jgi:phosphotransferase system enzyme I (PtsP)
MVLPSSPGVGIGRVVLAQQTIDLASVPERHTSNPDAELKVFRDALKSGKTGYA